MRRDGGSLDDLAMGLETGAISRGKAIKLSGAALAASALGLFASRGAEAQEDVETAVTIAFTIMIEPAWRTHNAPRSLWRH